MARGNPANRSRMRTKSTNFGWKRGTGDWIGDSHKYIADKVFTKVLLQSVFNQLLFLELLPSRLLFSTPWPKGFFRATSYM